jgi:hypothetical protein
MLAASGEVGYISEPLNVLHRPGVMNIPVRRWYTYICADNESEYLPALRQTLAFHYHLGTELLSLRSRKDLLRLGRDWGGFVNARYHRLRPLLKDPFAVFSIPWFIERLGCQVVVTVRHPAAFASSLKRLGWTFQLEDLLAQPLLMRDGLEPFRTQMETISPEDRIGRASLLWKMIYQMVDEYHRRYPQLEIVCHEELSQDPVSGFRSIYSDLDLDFTSGAQMAILNSSSDDNPVEVSPTAVHSIRLDSRASLGNWKRRLDAGEIARVRQITAGMSECYYPASSWE